MTRKYWLNPLVGFFVLTACGDDTTPADTDNETETSTSTSGTMSTTTLTTTMPMTEVTTVQPTTGDTDDTDTTGIVVSTGEEEESATTMSETTGPPPMPVSFEVTITNTSDETPMPTPFSPGVWLTHELGSTPVFQSNMAETGIGLVELAEDGNAGPLDTGVDGIAEVLQHGIFNTPDGAPDPGPIMPGDSYSFTIEDAPVDSRLSIVTMLVNSNDIFLGTGPNGVSLYLPNGSPEAEDDIADVMDYWDVGSEANQPPSGGAYQAGAGAPPNTGPDETGMVSLKDESTHSIPFASKLAVVDVTEDIVTGEWTIEIANLQTADGGFATPFSPFAWALLEESDSIFALGDDLSATAGFESLVEDGATTTFEATLGALASDSGVTAGATAPGEVATFVVTPDADNRFVWFAGMVVWSNDAFLSMEGAGIALLDDAGVGRNPATIEREFAAALHVFDAGTEINEATGLASPNNASSEGQVVPNQGDTEGGTIAYYNDPTNDFASVTDFIDVVVVQNTPTTFDVTITNTSDGAPFQGFITPVVWATHDGTYTAFTDGMAASPDIEDLAEDGITAGLEGDIAGAGLTITDTGTTGALDHPTGGGANSVTFTVTAAAGDQLSLWAMVVPSNDTFVSLGSGGIELYGGGTPLDNPTLAANVTAGLALYDAGTEGNQAGAGGGAMAGVGPAMTIGPTEGNGLVRQAEDDPIWAHPAPNTMIEVVVSPVR